MSLIINYLKKSRVVRVLESVYGYTYLKHIIELWPGDGTQKLSKINEK